ncbi:MAG TPA: hypothetical protein VEU08_17215 [Vicinamibacterales bacterium]|nr:hypothetical protein [Vicinamibacterales bacterium]
MGSFVGDPTEKLIAPHYVLNRTGNAAQIVRQDEAHANARLIAAAPELLAASKLFTDACHEVVLALNGAGLACPSSIAFAAEQARHAIAKAEGRS